MEQSHSTCTCRRSRVHSSRSIAPARSAPGSALITFTHRSAAEQVRQGTVAMYIRAERWEADSSLDVTRDPRLLPGRSQVAAVARGRGQSSSVIGRLGSRRLLSGLSPGSRVVVCHVSHGDATGRATAAATPLLPGSRRGSRVTSDESASHRSASRLASALCWALCVPPWLCALAASLHPASTSRHGPRPRCLGSSSTQHSLEYLNVRFESQR
jgi:hypothetical protein